MTRCSRFWLRPSEPSDREDIFEGGDADDFGHADENSLAIGRESMSAGSEDVFFAGRGCVAQIMHVGIFKGDQFLITTRKPADVDVGAGDIEHDFSVEKLRHEWRQGRRHEAVLRRSSTRDQFMKLLRQVRAAPALLLLCQLYHQGITDGHVSDFPHYLQVSQQ